MGTTDVAGDAGCGLWGAGGVQRTAARVRKVAMSMVFRAALMVVLASVGAASCASTRAEVPVERPALDVPPPPPRTIVPLPPPPEAPRPDPVQDLPEGSTSPTAKPRPPREKEAPKTEPKTTEEKPVEPAPPANTPSPVPPLRIPDTGDPNQQTAQIRAGIDRTLETLNGIDYQKLQQPRQKAYDDAKLFAQQAEQALKEKNLVLAKEYADKAERLTKELTGR